MSTHAKTASREAVLASTDTEWLYDVAGECDVDPAEADECGNCLAYIRAQELEDQKKAPAAITVAELIAALRNFNGNAPVHVRNGAHWSEVKSSAVVGVLIDPDDLNPEDGVGRVYVSSVEEDFS